MYVFFPKVALSLVAVLALASHASSGAGRSDSEEVDNRDLRVVCALSLLLRSLMWTGCHARLSGCGGEGLCREPQLLRSWR